MALHLHAPWGDAIIPWAGSIWYCNHPGLNLLHVDKLGSGPGNFKQSISIEDIYRKGFGPFDYIAPQPFARVRIGTLKSGPTVPGEIPGPCEQWHFAEGIGLDMSNGGQGSILSSGLIGEYNGLQTKIFAAARVWIKYVAK